jgi:hypothetical protein
MGSRCGARREPSAEHGGDNAERDRGKRGIGLPMHLRRRGDNSVDRSGNRSHDLGRARRKRIAAGDAHERTQHAHDQSFKQKHAVDVVAFHADGAQHADFFPALIHGDGEGIEDDVNADEQRDETGDLHADAQRADGVFEILAASLRRLHLERGGQLRFQALLHGCDGNIRRGHQVDAIEFVAAPENDLRGVNVHDGDVSAEDRSDAHGLENSFHREIFSATGREQRQSVADFERMALGEGARKQDRGRLSEVGERIDNLSLRFIEFVVAQLRIAGGVHAQNQEVAFAGVHGARVDFDHRLGDLHAGRCADGVQNLFGETGFAGGDLQIGFSRDFFDGELQRIEQSHVGGANGEKDRDSKRDAQRGENHANPVRAPLPPGDQPQREEH